MYQRILVPLDGSKLAEQVIPYVQLFQENLGSRIELIQVIETASHELENSGYRAYLDRLAATRQADSKNYLQELAERMRESGVAVSWTVRQGDPTTIIKAEAELEPSTLIAMGTHGRSGQTRWWLGSTTDKVIHASTNPLLIIRSREQEIIKPRVRLNNCIVPLDGSALAEQILPHVLSVAKAFSLKVVLVRAIPEIDSHYWELFPEAYDEDRDGQARQYLTGISEDLHQQGVTDTEVRLLHGHPASTLADFVRQTPHNLTAMTTHGLGSSGLYRWTMGTVTQRVIGHSRDPVLVVRASESKASSD
jgi:nucleotide-binding universal stress UspA family protein